MGQNLDLSFQPVNGPIGISVLPIPAFKLGQNWRAPSCLSFVPSLGDLQKNNLVTWFNHWSNFLHVHACVYIYIHYVNIFVNVCVYVCIYWWIYPCFPFPNLLRPWSIKSVSREKGSSRPPTPEDGSKWFDPNPNLALFTWLTGFYGGYQWVVSINQLRTGAHYGFWSMSVFFIKP